MGKACLLLGGAAMTLLGLHYAASAIPQVNPNIPLILFVIFSVLAGAFVVTGTICLQRLIKRRLHPLDILDDIQCTYLTKEKQVKVTLWICDYSNSPEFILSCIAQFGYQSINVNDKKVLDGPYNGNTYCRCGRRRMIEFIKNDAEVKDPSQCFVTITMKPLGMWATRRKSKEVITQVVKH